MATFLYGVVFLALAACAFASSASYVPKSFYRIDENGEKSDTVYVNARSRRASGSGGTSYSGSFSSSGGGAGPGSAGDVPLFFDGPSGGDPSSFIDQLHTHISRLAETANSQAGPDGTKVYTRFNDDGSGVQVGGTAVGTRGSFSSSSSSVDENGKVRYSVKTGKY